MLFSGTFARGAAAVVCSSRKRLIAGAIGSGSAAVALLLGAPTALADPPPPPNCTAADFANVSGNVALATSGYLATHADVNDFFTSLDDERTPEQRARVVDYFNAHPQVHDELDAIRQPLNDIKDRCGFNDDDPDDLNAG